MASSLRFDHKAHRARKSLVEDMADEFADLLNAEDFDLDNYNLRDLFDEIDINQNGELDMDEFGDALATAGIDVSRSELTFLYNDFDVNGDGSIDVEELIDTLQHFEEKMEDGVAPMQVLTEYVCTKLLKSKTGRAKKAEKRLWVMNRKYKHAQKKLVLEKEKLKMEQDKSSKLQRQLDIGRKQLVIERNSVADLKKTLQKKLDELPELTSTDIESIKTQKQLEKERKKLDKLMEEDAKNKKNLAKLQ